jgi:hypothetical protein
MLIPPDLKIFSGTCGSPDGVTVVSLRFLLTKEEFDFAKANDIIPEDTTEVLHMESFELPALHDIHMPSAVLQ